MRERDRERDRERERELEKRDKECVLTLLSDAC